MVLVRRGQSGDRFVLQFAGFAIPREHLVANFDLLDWDIAVIGVNRCAGGKAATCPLALGGRFALHEVHRDVHQIAELRVVDRVQRRRAGKQNAADAAAQCAFALQQPKLLCSSDLGDRSRGPGHVEHEKNTFFSSLENSRSEDGGQGRARSLPVAQRAKPLDGHRSEGYSREARRDARFHLDALFSSR